MNLTIPEAAAELRCSPKTIRTRVVYFMESVGLTKIGRTINLEARLRDIRAMSAVPVEVVLTLEGDHVLEAALHRRFAGHRRHGEWFSLPDGWERQVDEVAADCARVSAAPPKTKQPSIVSMLRDEPALREIKARTGLDKRHVGWLLRKGRISGLSVDEIEIAVDLIKEEQRGMPLDVMRKLYV